MYGLLSSDTHHIRERSWINTLYTLETCMRRFAVLLQVLGRMRRVYDVSMTIIHRVSGTGEGQQKLLRC